ncbi:MAG: tRNA (cytidine(34)-2'-O)-methyltransferase [Verrucomicrobiales bacterium]|nr:tRNA (cytidine(34)-2'-O)-methyltransferase [Verrucomicrobiales bacterium]
MLNVVLIEPEIPPNTGNIGRLCMAAGARLHLVGPLGFSLDDKSLKRAGLDYWHELDLSQWQSFDELLESADDGSSFYYLTTKSEKPYWSAKFCDNDYIVFGPETRGLPDSLLAENDSQALTIPQKSGRSLNLATSVGITLYEAVRQLSVCD